MEQFYIKNTYSLIVLIAKSNRITLFIVKPPRTPYKPGTLHNLAAILFLTVNLVTCYRAQTKMGDTLSHATWIIAYVQLDIYWSTARYLNQYNYYKDTKRTEWSRDHIKLLLQLANLGPDCSRTVTVNIGRIHPISRLNIIIMETATAGIWMTWAGLNNH